MKKTVLPIFVFLFFLASCSITNEHSIAKLFQSDTSTPVPSLTASSTATPDATSTVTPSPLPSSTITPSATPMGGKPLRVAYLGFDCETVNSARCVVIADFFTQQALYRIPIGDEADSVNLSWSPDGRYLIYTNVVKNIMHIMLYDMVLTSSTEIDTHIYRKPVTEDGVYYPYPFQVYPEWSADSQYITYNMQVYSLTGNTYNNEKKLVLPADLGHNYYWLDDNVSLVDIDTGKVYSLVTGKMNSVTKAYFMKAIQKDEFILSYKGENTVWTHEVYLLPYITDLEVLQENGMKALYDNELFFAYADDNDVRDTSLHIDDVFIHGNQVIFTGALTRTLPYERQNFVRFETMSEMPFHIEIDTETGYARDQETLLMISPDEKMYFTMDYIWDGEQNTSSLIKNYSLDDHELISIYDIHELSEEFHDVIYSRYENLAFYWEEE